MNESKNGKKVGSELILSILSEADNPLSTREIQEETKKAVGFCLASNVVFLNLLRIRGIIQGKRNENKNWVWWINK